MIGIYHIQRANQHYVGQSIHVPRRLRHHRSLLDRNKHHNPMLQRSWNKYGASDFIFELLEECPVEDLDARETYWTVELEAHTVGWSVATPGYAPTRGRKHSPETRAKLSASTAGKPRRPLSDETKAKISAANLGRKRTPEFCEQARKLATGRKHSEEHKAAFSETMRGHVVTAETRAKIGAANRAVQALKRKESSNG